MNAKIFLIKCSLPNTASELLLVDSVNNLRICEEIVAAETMQRISFIIDLPLCINMCSNWSWEYPAMMVIHSDVCTL